MTLPNWTPPHTDWDDPATDWDDPTTDWDAGAPDLTIHGFRARARPLPPVVDAPPSVPTGLTGFQVGPDMHLTWIASTDDYGVVVYAVRRNGAFVGWAGPEGFVDSVSLGQTYTWTVEAADNHEPAQVSGQSAGFSYFMETTPDTTAPTVPASVATSYNAGTQTVTITWTASTDDTGVREYLLWVNDVLIGTGTASLTATYVVDSTDTYEFQVSAIDYSDNESAKSTKTPAATEIVTITPPPDLVPPSTPTGLTATSTDGVHVTVAWGPSTDAGTGVLLYIVERNGGFIAYDAASPYVDTLPVGTTGAVTYSVRAIDNATPPNHSAEAHTTITIAAGNVYTPGVQFPAIVLSAGGVVDTSASMQAFLNAVPNGTAGNPNIISLPSNAVYRCEKEWWFYDRRYITVRWNGAQLIQNDPKGGTPGSVPGMPYRNRPGVKITGGIDVVHQDGRIRGANPNGGFLNVYGNPGVQKNAYVEGVNGTTPNSNPDAFQAEFEGQPGFEVDGNVNGLTILNFEVNDCYGDAVSIERGGINPSQHASNIVIDNLRGARNGRQWVGCSAVTGLIIRNCTAQDMRRAWVDLEPEGNPLTTTPTVTYPAVNMIEDVDIYNNFVGKHRLKFFAGGGRGQMRNVDVHDNFVQGGTDGCNLDTLVADINHGRRGPIRIHNNVCQPGERFSSPGQSGTTKAGAVMKFTDVDGLTVTQNHQPFHTITRMYMVNARNCDNVDVTPYNTIPTPLTGHAQWEGGDGQIRYEGPSGATLGFSPTYTT